MAILTPNLRATVGVLLLLGIPINFLRNINETNPEDLTVTIEIAALTIIFAILIHVRLNVKDRGLWTALLAVAGCLVMLFNWIFINFFLLGLHSYA